ncbi:MMPL family transporter [Trueperella pyogenes]|uniref:MMPL family transporter n=1 Tax=Trueperella pyogenes TaxID=1661 RepID=UPI0012D30BCF|nr:MMPL family transporter [Trueperella pyogenes]
MRTLVKKVGDSASDDGVFSRLARWVHRRPWPILLAVTAVLLIMAAPIRDLSMRSNFMEYIPEHTSASRAYTAMQSYRPLATPSVTVIAQTTPENAADLVKYIQQIDSVAWVHDPAPFTDDETVVEFYMNVDDQVGPEVTKAVEDLRSFETSYVKSVGGPAALQLDFTNSIKEGAPVAAAVVALAVLILLFLMTGSVIAPIMALLINTLSLVAGMGATVFVFENGLFGLPQTVGLETFVVATALAFGLGLAMDYEVFLIARIKEYWDAGYDNDTAVEKGLQRSGRIITSAAAIIVAVFIGFIFGDLLAIKQVGVALALIVIIDATLVRMLLVPATMTILGKWNWWAPRPLKVVYEKFKLVH